jgi:hypothetical protein
MFLSRTQLAAIAAAVHRVQPAITIREFSVMFAAACAEMRVNDAGYLLWRGSILGKQLFVRISEAQNWRCCYCGTRTFIFKNNHTPNCATLEHVVPKCMGGDDHPDNLVMACVSCNSALGAKLSNGKHLVIEARVTE